MRAVFSQHLPGGLLDIGPFFTRRQQKENRHRLPDISFGFAKGVREAAIVFHKGRELSETSGTLWICEDLAYSPFVASARLPEGYEHGQGYLPLGQIATRLFPGARPIRDVVLNVVEQLEGHAELQPENLKSTNLFGLPPTEETPQLTGHGKQRGGLLLDDLEAGSFSEPEVSLILEFHRLAFDELDQGFHRKGQDGGMSRPEGKIYDRGQEEIACEDGHAVSPEAVDGGPIPTDPRSIHDVVMKEGPVVQGFHKGRSLCKMRGCVTEQAGGQTKEPGAKAFPFRLKHKANDRL